MVKRTIKGIACFETDQRSDLPADTWNGKIAVDRWQAGRRTGPIRHCQRIPGVFVRKKK